MSVNERKGVKMHMHLQQEFRGLYVSNAMIDEAQRVVGHANPYLTQRADGAVDVSVFWSRRNSSGAGPERRLLLAVFLQALADAESGSDAIRADVRDWLTSAWFAWCCEALGLLPAMARGEYERRLAAPRCRGNRAERGLTVHGTFRARNRPLVASPKS